MASAPRVYLDNAATTPVDPRVLDAMREVLAGTPGNPSSMHAEGREAAAVLDRARERVAALLGARPAEIVFTSGGTEADAAALLGVQAALAGRPFHLVTTAFEHPAVLETCREVERRGGSVTRMAVGADGVVDADDLRGAFRPDTRLVSVMAAQNVVGTLQPVHALARIAKEHGALFHTDAVQALGKVPLDAGRDPFDLASVSAHKIRGPKGVGALFVREGTPFRPLLPGGGQESGRRSGTENVAGIAGFGEAAALAGEDMGGQAARLVRLRDRLVEGVEGAVPGAYVLGDRHRRLPGHACLGFDGLEGETVHLMLALDEAGFAVSTGSACGARHAGQASHVLTAMGFDPFRARGALRVTLDRGNTEEDVDRFLEALPRAVAGLRPIASRRGTTEEAVR